MSDKVDTESFAQLERLRELRVSHRDLDYLIVNLGMLRVFKYFNFFADNFYHVSQLMGLNISPLTL